MEDYNCNMCGYSTNVKQRFLQHKKTKKHVRNTTCSYCGKRLHKKNIYLEHLLVCKKANASMNIGERFKVYEELSKEKDKEIERKSRAINKQHKKYIEELNKQRIKREAQKAQEARERLKAAELDIAPDVHYLGKVLLDDYSNKTEFKDIKMITYDKCDWYNKKEYRAKLLKKLRRIAAEKEKRRGQS